MSPERWQRVKNILEAVEDCAGPARDAEIRRLSGDDPSLFAEVVSLLACETRIGIFDRAPALRPITGVPERIGPYQILKSIGAGGMGTVYLAERADDQYRKYVAIKVIQIYDDRLIARFRSERQILASLEHPYIARLLDGGTLEDGRPYLVMDYVEGRRIDDYVIERKPSLTDILRLFLKTCSAVQFAHQKLVVHRDLKPGNILVSPDGEPRLLDFGIAKVLGDSVEPALCETQPFERMLTPTSATPEQIAGAPVTTATDVYSLAVLLYSMLTGASPYAAAKDFAISPARVIAEYEPPLASTVPGLGRSESYALKGDLDNILARALEKDPLRRYPTVDELARDVQNFLDGEPVRARPVSVAYRVRKFVRRNRVSVGAAVLVALAVVAGSGASLWYAHRAHVERLRAEHRFESLRTLSESLLFELHDSIENLPGSTPARSLIARRAVQYLDQLAADAGNDAIVLADLASGYQRVAAIQAGQRGPHLGGPLAASSALETDRKALAIRKHLSAAKPDDEVIQRDMLASMWAVAEGVRAEGDLNGALKLHLERLRLVEQQLSKHRTKDLQYSISASDSAIGDLYRTLGDNPRALDYIRKGLVIRQAILDANPADQRARRLTGLSHEFVGYVLDAKGEDRGAALEHQEAVRIFEPLAAANPTNGGIERLLFVAENNLCETLAKCGSTREAEKHCRQATAVAAAMAKADPQNAQAGEDLASAYSTMSVAVQAGGRDREALVWEQRAEALYRTSLARDPDSIDVVVGLVDSLLNLAEIGTRLKMAATCSRAEEAGALAAQVARRSPEDQTLRTRLTRAQRLISRCK